MKKILPVFFIFLVFTACSLDYKHQLQKPEYYLKSSTIEIKPNKNTLTPTEIQIRFFGLTSTISSKWFDHEKLQNGCVAYRLQNELKFLISFDPMGKMGCDKPIDDNERDFCSAFKSPQEYYDKTWTLTPDDLEKPPFTTRGDYMIVRQKEMWFTNPKVTAIYKYRGNNFVAYRRDFKSGEGNKSIKSELVIFHQKIAPNAIGVGSLVDHNDELFNQMLSTLE